MNRNRSKIPTSRSSGRGSVTVTSNVPCSSCGRSPTRPTGAARYDAQGNCVSTRDVSCETRWQMRDCLKLGLCEFVACLADEYCVDGEFAQPVDENGNRKDVGDVLLSCLGEAFCSTLHCLPTAICGSEQDTDCVPPPPVLGCNFAVEERD